MRRRDWLLLLAGGAPALDGASARAFRGWFCWLAELVYHLSDSARPSEVKDCSSLARFAYREALKKHDAAWLNQWGFPAPPALPEPSRAAAPLFHVDEGQLRFFADAAHLMRHNSVQISRQWQAAQPGDLLFFRQAQADSAYHMMIFLGASLFDDGPGPYAVYHTGPARDDSGEMRRPLIAELLAHPEPRWRPAAANPAFQGVYRWKLMSGGPV
jgi:uncharacterized protein YfaT (DUF1175 family)